MQLSTKYDIGDKIYAAYEHGSGSACGPFTIGMIQAELFDSPGTGEDTVFDNYKPKKAYHVNYMCVETGIGCGSVFSEDRIFLTFKEAQKKLMEAIECKS